MDKLIITVALTGNVPTKEMNPHVPITPDEIAESAYKCWKAGASVAHIHARDAEGKPTTDVEVFREIVDKIRERCDIIVQLSTGARGGKTMEERSAPLVLKPEMASLSTGSSNFPASINANSPELIRHLAVSMLENGIKPEIEVFDAAMISNAEYLAARGLIKQPMQFNLVMNVPGSIKGTPKNLMFLIENLPKGSTWTVSGIGTSHRQMTAMALILGGGVRVGLEDVLELEKGRPVSNEQLVERVAALAKLYGRDIATPAEARQMLGLKR